MASMTKRIKALQEFYPGRKIVEITDHTETEIGRVVFDDGTSEPDPTPVPSPE